MARRRTKRSTLRGRHSPVNLRLVIVAVVVALTVCVLGFDALGRQSGDTVRLVGDGVDVSEEELDAIAPQVPVRIQMDAIGVDAPIVPVGTDSEGRMAASDASGEVAWYELSAKLGSKKRAVLLNGHYGVGIPQVFRRLNELKVDDRFSLVGEKGATATYKVVETERLLLEDVDMEKAFNYGEGKEAVSIITCIGTYDYVAKTYDERFIVYAERVE